MTGGGGARFSSERSTAGKKHVEPRGRKALCGGAGGALTRRDLKQHPCRTQMGGVGRGPGAGVRAGGVAAGGGRGCIHFKSRKWHMAHPSGRGAAMTRGKRIKEFPLSLLFAALHHYTTH